MQKVFYNIFGRRSKNYEFFLAEFERHFQVLSILYQRSGNFSYN
jgi:hypothetical protein